MTRYAGRNALKVTSGLLPVFIVLSMLAIMGNMSVPSSAHAAGSDYYEQQVSEAQSVLDDAISTRDAVIDEQASLQCELMSAMEERERAEAEKDAAAVALYKISREPGTVIQVLLFPGNLAESIATWEDYCRIVRYYRDKVFEADSLVPELEGRIAEKERLISEASTEVDVARAAFDAAVEKRDALKSLLRRAAESGTNEDLARVFCSLAYSRKVKLQDGYPRTQAYAAAYDAIWQAQGDGKWKAGKVQGRSCDRGVATAVVLAGFDDAFPRSCGGASWGQWKHMSGSPRWANLGTWSGRESDLMPGDVLIRIAGVSPGAKNNHVCMYVGHDVIMDVYENVLRGTDADLGVPDAGAAWVSSGYGDGAGTGRAPGMGRDGDKSMTVFRCVSPQHSTRYSDLLR